MDNKLLIIVGGYFHLLFAVFHLFFWRVFNWKKDLAYLTNVNRGIMQVLNLCLTFVFFVIAFICISYPGELLTSQLGRVILISISIFWLFRTIYQFLFFSLRKKFSLILTVLFVAGFIIYAMAFIGIEFLFEL